MSRNFNSAVTILGRVIGEPTAPNGSNGRQARLIVEMNSIKPGDYPAGRIGVFVGSQRLADAVTAHIHAQDRVIVSGRLSSTPRGIELIAAVIALDIEHLEEDDE